MSTQIFWQGIIENNNDPLKLGRCQVRVIGIHTENKADSTQVNYVPVEDLPWAQLMFPVQSPNISGQCDFALPKNGSLVLCAFLDPERQVPIVIGTFPRVVNVRPNYEQGFSDPDQVHPIEGLLGESSISRLARNENIDQTIIQTKKDSVKTDVICDAVTWTEPQTLYDATYTKNRVIETEKHHIELDDTEGKERIHIYHNSGTSKEMHPNGDEVDRIKNKRFTIVISDDNILIEGNSNIHINGSENVTIGQNNNVDIKGNNKINIDGHSDVDIGSYSTLDIGTNCTINVGNNKTEDVTNDKSVNSGNNYNNTAGAVTTITAPQINLVGNLSATGTGGATGTSYEKANKTHEGNVGQTGNLTITGNISVTGNISATGTIIDGAGNTANHTH